MVKVKVPASSANLGSGTDCVGVALPLYLNASFAPADSLRILYEAGEAPQQNPQNDLISIAARRVYEMAGKPFTGMHITVSSDIPLCSGLGSSASAIVAGMCGANALLGNPFSTAQLIDAASALEGHADNIVACFLGGFTVSVSDSGHIHYSSIKLDAALSFIAVHPHNRLSTKHARAVLPKDVPMDTALAQLQRGCYLVAVMQNRDYEQLAVVADDRLFTPARRSLVKGFDAVTAAAVAGGAYCAVISGAGPTIVALAPSGPLCGGIAEAMRQAFAAQGIDSTAYILQADNDGAQIQV